jgi:phage shock protein PspC (stress-responsive transcriptional regulator)/predicted membrane protein
MIGGVCGGLGQYFDVNPVFYRIGFVVLALLGGAGILIYGASLLVIPNEGEGDSIAADVLRNHRQRPAALLGLALVALAGIALLSHLSFRIHSEGFWVVVLVGGALILWSQRRTTHVVATDAPVVAVPRRRSWLTITLVTFGVLVVIAIAAFVTLAATYMHLGDGIGSRTYAPTSTAALQRDYRLGTGHLTLDLSGLDVARGTTTVAAHVGIGQLEVTVPRDAKVRVLGHVSWGDAKILGNDENGHDVDTVLGSAAPQLVVDAHVGAGEIEVRRAVR